MLAGRLSKLGLPFCSGSSDFNKMAAPDGVQMQRGLWLRGYWWGVFGSCWWGWGYRFTQVLKGVLWGCLEGLAKATMAGWRSSGECLGGLGIWRGLRLGQAIFFFTRKKEINCRGVLCLGVGGVLGGLDDLGGQPEQRGGEWAWHTARVGIGNSARNSAQMRAMVCKRGGRPFCRQFWGRQFSRQFFGNSGLAIPRQFSFIK